MTSIILKENITGPEMVMATRTAVHNGELKPSVLRDIVRRVVHAARPAKIMLFGSAARGQMGPNSDVDLLVVNPVPSLRGNINER
jgi:predicted nucleotidyltransferase